MSPADIRWFTREDGERVLQVDTYIGWQDVPDVRETTLKDFKAVNPVCEECHRNTQAPLFDGCMTPNCPRGYEPCL